MDAGSFDNEENKKSLIVERFNSRINVIKYFEILKNSHMIPDDKKNEFIGIGEEVKQDINELFEIYGICPMYLEEYTIVQHPDCDWWYEMWPLEDKDAEMYLPLFFKEISIYPISFMKNSQIKFIYFCSNLTFSAETYTQYRSTVNDYNEESMAMIYCAKERQRDYIKNIVHHELFHYIDYIDDGKVYGPEPGWECLNTPDFTYGTGGVNCREWKPLNPDIKGFLNNYSTTGLEEDKAEIYAFMINTPNKINCHECEIINKKVDYIMELLIRFDSKGLGNKVYWDWLELFRENYYS